MYYNNLSDYYKKKFGCKVIKLSFNGGFTCPNRINGNKGCIFCSGSFEYAGNITDSLEKQYVTQRDMMDKKWPGAKYIAYFGSFTNTFDTVDNLRKRFETVLKFDNVIGLSIGTRCDCIDDECLEYLKDLNSRTFLTVELGLQSTFDDTLKRINRGHDVKSFIDCVNKLKINNINVVVHLINGFPWETKDMMLQNIEFLNKLNIDGIKIHNLFIIKNTVLGNDYFKEPFKIMDRDEYINIVCKQLEILNPKIVVHRLTGDPKKEDLIAPLWSVKKIDLLNGIVKKLKSDKSYQGKFYNL